MAKPKAVSLSVLVAATLVAPFFLTLHPDSVKKLVASGDAEINPKVPPNDAGEVQVRASKKAIDAAQATEGEPSEASAEGSTKYLVEEEYEPAPVPVLKRGRTAGKMLYPFDALVAATAPADVKGMRQFFVVGAEMKKFSTTVGFANRKYSKPSASGEMRRGPHGMTPVREYDRHFVGKNDVNARGEKGVRVWRTV